MFAEEIRRAIEAAPRVTLSAVTALLWRAFGAGQITETEAEALSNLIEARKLVPAAPGAAQRRVGSRPRTDASMARRRRWAASGWLPPAIAARFTLAETAALATVAAEIERRGDCRLSMDHLAGLAGVSRSTVKAAIREAKKLGLITTEERRQTAWRHRPNIVRVVSPEWRAWLSRRARTQGVKAAPSTNTRVQDRLGRRPSEPAQRAAGGQSRRRSRGKAGDGFDSAADSPSTAPVR